MTDGALIPFREISEREQVAALEAEIARGRERVAASFGELQRHIQRATSWRHWVGAHPLAWICAGVCLGLMVGRGGRAR
jgi:hypothetical protein